MSPFSCAREREVTDLLHQGFWPQACPPELRAHVDACRICSDLVLVTETMRAARRQSAELPRLEPPGATWWRAQLRRRNAAIEKVTKPILGAQLFALAVALVVAVGVVIWQADNWRAWIADLPRALHLDALIPASIGNSGGTLWIVVPLLAMIALLSGVVVYLASEKQ
jgi:hypothetical protein